MKPQEKALSIYNKMIVDFKIDKWQTKQCALVAVEEIIQTLNYDLRDIDVVGNNLFDLIKYWREVKTEIEKL